MRVICFFDLPTITAFNRKEYRVFRKYLIMNGFVMLQESVYCKMVPNSNIAQAVVDGVKRNRPNDGLVQALRITEKQFQNMDYILGEKKTEVLDTDERLVFL